jgi:hypothetical protein
VPGGHGPGAGEPVDHQRGVAVEDGQVHGLAGAGDQVLQVREGGLAHRRRAGQQAEPPHPGAHLVEAVGALVEQPAVDQVAEPALGGGQRDPAAAGYLGEAQHPVAGVERVQQAERAECHRLARGRPDHAHDLLLRAGSLI